MFEARTHKRIFYSAPEAVSSLIADFLEPGIALLVLVLASMAFGEPIDRPVVTLGLLVLAVTFPGRNRFRDKPLAAAVDIVTTWLTLLVVFGLCAYATQSFKYFERDVLLFWALATPLLQWVAVWVGAKIVRHNAARPAARRAAIIVGGGALGVRVAGALRAGDDRGIDFIGYFDDRTDERLDEAAAPLRLGGLHDIAGYVAAHGIREVFITLPLGSQPRIVELLEHLQRTTASIFFVPDVFGITVIQGRLLDMNGVPVVGICETPFTGTNELVKRASDIVLASIILVLISPVLLAVAIGVKLSSPGPVIFKQRRNGLSDEEIIVYKFRSMRAAGDGSAFKQATRNDPRVTKFGAFIRRTSLDELPQFINVLQGRMSIVGPRPHPVELNAQYRQIIKAYIVRHKVKPGLTGWAQVNGYRGETDTLDKMKARIEYDLDYLRNWSLRLDLQIIASTVRLVLMDGQAY
jgi:putative colanic acid biosynthesis UDP-glucose lipid carrier transferase